MGNRLTCAEFVQRSCQVLSTKPCFQGLFEAGAENRSLNRRHLTIRKKIMDAVAETPSVGGYQRVMALRDFAPMDGETSLFHGPALVLLAEGEEDILVPASPTLAAMKNPDIRSRILSMGRVRTVHSLVSDDPVAHASLIFHHHCYNPLMEAWYDRLQAPVLFAAV